MSGKKRWIIIYTEGETEEEFYGKVLCVIKEKYSLNRFNADKITKKCLRGITKFDKKLLRKFEIEISPQCNNYDVIVILCYDTDVFDCSSNPPVDWNNVEDKLLELGAAKVIHIKAEKCIEDVFLLDIPGVCKYLKIPEVKKITGDNGVDKMQKLFNKGNKVYQKGYKCDGFVSYLNIEKIMAKTQKMLQPFIDELTPKGK